MADCPRQVRSCDVQTIAAATEAECPDWEVCLPFGARLYQQDGCVRYEPGTPPEDGVYGLVTVQNGCIVGMEAEPVAKYQSDPCAPVPCPCDSSEDGESNLCNPSTKSGNQYECDAAGRPYAHAYVQAGDNVTVQGNGTSTNPYIISADDGDSGITNVRTNTGSVLTVSVSNGTATIDHATGYNEQTINGMTFDAYGHLKDYSSTSASTSITAVIGTGGVKATTESSVVTVSLDDVTNKLAGQYLLGGYIVEVDAYNRLYNITKEITDVEGTYQWGAYNVTVNDLGSVTNVEAVTESAPVFHAFLASEETTTQHTLTFTMKYTSRAIIDVYAVLPDTTVSSGTTTTTQTTPFEPSFYIDDERHQNTLDLSSGESKHVRLYVTGSLGTGEHTLNIRCDNFPTDTNMSVQITLVTTFDSTTSTEDETEE